MVDISIGEVDALGDLDGVARLGPIERVLQVGEGVVPAPAVASRSVVVNAPDIASGPSRRCENDSRSPRFVAPNGGCRVAMGVSFHLDSPRTDYVRPTLVPDTDEPH